MRIWFEESMRFVREVGFLAWVRTELRDVALRLGLTDDPLVK